MFGIQLFLIFVFAAVGSSQSLATGFGESIAVGFIACCAFGALIGMAPALVVWVGTAFWGVVGFALAGPIGAVAGALLGFGGNFAIAQPHLERKAAQKSAQQMTTSDTHRGKRLPMTQTGKLDLSAYDVNELNFHAMKLSKAGYLSEIQFSRIMIDIKNSNIGHLDVSEAELRRLKDVFTSDLRSVAVLHEAGLISDVEREALLPDAERRDAAVASVMEMLAD